VHVVGFAGEPCSRSGKFSLTSSGFGWFRLLSFVDRYHDLEPPLGCTPAPSRRRRGSAAPHWCDRC
jgi:hypothetical protein